MAKVNVICPNCGAKLETDNTNTTALCYECFNAFVLTEDIIHRSKTSMYATSKTGGRATQSTDSSPGFENGESIYTKHQSTREMALSGNSYFDLASSYGLEEEPSSSMEKAWVESKSEHNFIPQTPGLKDSGSRGRHEDKHAKYHGGVGHQDAHANSSGCPIEDSEEQFHDNYYHGATYGHKESSSRSRGNSGSREYSSRGKHSATQRPNSLFIILMSVLIILASVIIILLMVTKLRNSEASNIYPTIGTPLTQSTEILEESPIETPLIEAPPTETEIVQAPAQAQGASYIGFWQRDYSDVNNTISIYYHAGQTISLYVSCVRGIAAQIAFADIPFITLQNNRGEFKFRDTFGNIGSGTIIFSGNSTFSIDFYPESTLQSWGIISAAGAYFNTGLPPETHNNDGFPLGAIPPVTNFKVWEYGFSDVICYATFDHNITTYVQIGVPFEGKSYIDGSATSDADVCVIKQFYDNGWMKVAYQTYNGVKTAYCYTSDFMNLDASGVVETSTFQDEVVYKKPNLYEKLGTIASRDTAYVVSSQGNVKQIIYPLDTGGWKMGWIASAKLR